MNQVQLDWEGPFNVSELKKKFFEERISDLLKDPTYYWMTWPGIYAFLNQNHQVLYIGSATKSRGNALRTRIREHLKGDTKFSFRLRKNNVNMDDLQLIVAPVMKDEVRIDILKMERILSFEMNPPGNSDDLVIVNCGNFNPLPQRIRAGISKYSS